MKLRYLCKTLFKQPATPMTPSTAPPPSLIAVLEHIIIY